MNIDFPINIQKFTGYLDIATGDFSEMSGFIPDVVSYAINYTDINETIDNIPKRFQDLEIETPYLIIGYGKSTTLVLFTAVIILPGLLLMNRMCKKVRMWKNMI